MTEVQERYAAVEKLSEDLMSTAEWRRRKADQFPEDSRNLEAAADLEELAGEILNLSGTDLDDRLSRAADGADCEQWQETKSELLRDVGFRWAGSASKLVEDLISQTARRVADDVDNDDIDDVD